MNRFFKRIFSTKIIRKKKIRESMEVIRLYAFIIFMMIFLYLFWFTIEAIVSHPDLESFREFFNSVIAGSAVIGFLSRYLVDADGDGRPDAAASKKEDIDD